MNTNPFSSEKFEAWARAEAVLESAQSEYDSALSAFCRELHVYLAAMSPVDRLNEISKITALGNLPEMMDMAVTMIRQDTLETMPYGDYLRTEHWQSVRTVALERADDRCQACNADQRLQVHHRTYERRGKEMLEDLTVLCAACHKTFHEHRRLARD